MFSYHFLSTGNTLDELSIGDSLGLVVKSISDQLNESNSNHHSNPNVDSTHSNSLGAHLTNSIFSNNISTQPISIPGGTSALSSNNFSPTTSSPLSHFLSSRPPAPGFGTTADNLNQLDSNTNVFINHISQNQFSNTGFGRPQFNQSQRGPGQEADFQPLAPPLPPGSLGPSLPPNTVASLPLIEQRAKSYLTPKRRTVELSMPLLYNRLKNYGVACCMASETIEAWHGRVQRAEPTAETAGAFTPNTLTIHRIIQQ
ncbi:uncharacterized protein LOC113470919 [Diaphorina citri]|uniref:Uncharacterized protein LOC113470919 n=1 Tax=Diaphorina citri TaxID=121845 RepID=A0A3Q0JFN2_DIACI|nr:uncharacterized protein LOC113470919 [Diaphorina citri]